ncbi:MAG: TcpQ domain-containing protein [Alphaproteobacteria bacterium]|nr:TcpQ domain-containing protein [Alphaproteobacteria bacterium]
MPQKAFFPYCGAWTLALGVVLSSTSAHAGFQWEDRTDAGAVQIISPSLPSTTKSSGYSGKPEYISPLIITGDPVRAHQPAMAAPSEGVATVSQAVAPATVAAPSSPASLLPREGVVNVTSLPAPSAPSSAAVNASSEAGLTTLSVSKALQPTAAVAKPSGKIDLSTEKISAPAPSQEVVHGFASRVPLALALRQVLPADRGFSIDQGVDKDTQVSYKGGKPWGETLKAMLAPVGLDYREQGGIVTVARVAAAPAPASASALTPTPVPLAPALQPTKTQESGHFLALPMPSERQANVPAYDGWSAQRGDTLRKVLADWCSRAGVELKWVAEYDYPLEASAHFNGAFEDAVRGLLSGFDQARPQPIGKLHINQRAGQNVLVVQVRGNSYTN